MGYCELNKRNTTHLLSRSLPLCQESVNQASALAEELKQACLFSASTARERRKNENQ
jgi:hypothetical protein